MQNFTGKVVATQDRASQIVEYLSSSMRTIVHKLLTLHVHKDYRAKKNTTSVKNDLILWLQKPNSYRNYFFYKVLGLRALMEKRNISIVGVGGAGSSSISKDDRMGALAGTLDPARISVRTADEAT